MSDLAWLHPVGKGRQAKTKQHQGHTSGLLLLPGSHTGAHDENVSAEGEAGLGGEAGLSPAPISQGPTSSLCLYSSPGSAAPHKLEEWGVPVSLSLETQSLKHRSEATHDTSYHKPAGCLMLPSLFHLLSTYMHISVQTNCTTPSLAKNYWTEFRFLL